MPSPSKTSAGGSLSIAKKIAFAFVVVGFLLGVLEAICRVVEATDPSSQARLLRMPAKKAGAYRILVFGESTTWGAPVPELGFVAQLEFFLGTLRAPQPVEVFNLGQPGKSSAAALEAVSDSIDDDPDLLIVMSGHNEFLSRFPRLEAARRSLESLALGRTLARLLSVIHPAVVDSQRIMPERLYPYDRNSPDFAARIERYHRNIDAILGLAAARGVPVVLCTLPSNLADWPPVHRLISWALYDLDRDREIERLGVAIESGDLGGARESILRDLERYRDDAMLLYLLGRIELLSGDYGRAREYLLHAKDLDPYPWRAVSQVNEILRAASRREGVTLVDVERIFAEHAPHGVVGFSLVADNCHPTPLGSFLIAQGIVQAMAKHGILGGGRDPSPTLRLETFLDHFGESGDGPLRVRFLLATGKYSMKTPFYNYDAARMYLNQASRLEPANWEIWANLATVSLLESDVDRGLEELRKAKKLKGSRIDFEDRRRVPLLREALRQASVPLALTG